MLKTLRVIKADFQYETIYSLGSPENPSWSSDENFIFWSSYTNGVSNIYRINLRDNNIQAISNTLTGLFKPIYLNKDSLFAFEFTPEGFLPVIMPNKPAKKLYAINYLGEELLDKNPKLKDLTLKQSDQLNVNIGKENDYNSITNLKVNTFIPVISGFQNKKILGFFTIFQTRSLLMILQWNSAYHHTFCKIIQLKNKLSKAVLNSIIILRVNILTKKFYSFR